ncbi:hypothetical protein ACOME3_008873 [Neoechinorhynchus agilis]
MSYGRNRIMSEQSSQYMGLGGGRWQSRQQRDHLRWRQYSQSQPQYRENRRWSSNRTERSVSLFDIRNQPRQNRPSILYQQQPPAPVAYIPPTYTLYPYPPETDNGLVSEEDDPPTSSVDNRCEIFVGRLPVSIKQLQLIRTFGQYGLIDRCTLRDGGWQAYAFIKFAEPNSAKRAVRYEHGQMIFGYPMHVEYAKNLQGEYHTFTHRLEPTGISTNYCCDREPNHRPNCRWFIENATFPNNRGGRGMNRNPRFMQQRRSSPGALHFREFSGFQQWPQARRWSNY